MVMVMGLMKMVAEVVGVVVVVVVAGSVVGSGGGCCVKVDGWYWCSCSWW